MPYLSSSCSVCRSRALEVSIIDDIAVSYRVIECRRCGAVQNVQRIPEDSGEACNALRTSPARL